MKSQTSSFATPAQGGPHNDTNATDRHQADRVPLLIGTAAPNDDDRAFLERLHGARDLATFFGPSIVKAVPWPVAGELRTDRAPRLERLRRFLAEPAQLVDLDPRNLWAGQWGVTRHHTAYYLTGAWERTGITSTNRNSEFNRYPIIDSDNHGRLVIRSGHHRSLAALLLGKPLRCRLLAPDVDPGDARAVLPLLLTGTTTTVRHLKTDDCTEALRAIAAGTTVLVPPHVDTAAVAQTSRTHHGSADELEA